MKKISLLLALLCVLPLIFACSTEYENDVLYIRAPYKKSEHYIALDLELAQWYYEIDGEADVEGKIGIGHRFPKSITYTGNNRFFLTVKADSDMVTPSCDSVRLLEDMYTSKYYSELTVSVPRFLGLYHTKQPEAVEFETVTFSFAEGKHSGVISVYLDAFYFQNEINPGDDLLAGYKRHRESETDIERIIKLYYAKNDRYIVFDEDSVEDAQKKLKNLSS